MNLWTILGTKATGDEREIKRAYARKLKVTRPEDDPQAFQALREAYERALHMARQASQYDEDADEDGVDEVQERYQPTVEEKSAPRVEQALPVFTYHDTPVYTAAYEEDRIAVEEAPVYQAVYEAPFETVYQADPVPAPEPVSPMVEARRIWAQFLPNAHYDPGKQLARVTASEELLNLQVRDCFELCAVQYCAAEGCPEEFRVAVVEHYRWEDDASFVGRQMPNETGETLMRLRAHRSHVYFCDLAREDHVVRALLSDKFEKHFFPTARASFTKKMRELLAQVHWNHRDMLELKLNVDVFNGWVEHVESKRYFIETASYSFVAGIVLSLMAMFAFADFHLNGAVVFLACEALAFGLFALHAFKWPAISQKAPVVAARERVHAVLNLHRHHPGWQFGWIPAFVLASLCMLIPNPSELPRWAVTAVMFCCAVLGSFACSVAVSGFGFGLLGAIAAGLGFGIYQETFTAYGAVTCMLASMCFILLFYRGGADLLAFLRMRDAWFVPARAAWLAGAAALLFYSYTSIDSATTPVAAGAWLWVLIGTQLSRPSMNPVYTMAGAGFIAKILEELTVGESLLKQAGTPVLAFLIITIALFMAANMSRAKTNQHQFA